MIRPALAPRQQHPPYRAASVAANLRKQVPELLKQHNAKSVEFKVVIKDGKAVLKAVPK